MLISPRILSAATMAFLSFRVARGFSIRLTSSLSHARRSAASSAHILCSNNVNRNTNSIIPCYQYSSRRETLGLSKLFSTAAESETDEEVPKIPMTLLAGFLGSGKTSTLKNLLTNNDGLKIGIIVNDIASINIDAKLLANPGISSEETIELQNGCACCSLADELLTSVEKLMSGGRKLDAIVVELSGVADPVAVKSNWEQAEFLNHPATKLARMDKIVTLVDASTFGTDWMTWDTSGDRDGWVDPEDCEAGKKVPELLAEQVEAADVLVINKVDLAGEEQVAIASGLARVLNKDARLFETKFGEMSVKEVLQSPKVEKAAKEEKDCIEPGCTDATHDHSHSNDHAEDCADTACTDATHDHSHSNDHGEDCADTKCTDPTHDHSHDNDHEEPCAETACTDPTHDHSHSHEHTEACADPVCTDPTHDHSHTHEHKSTSADKLGITNFVYSSDRPFNPSKLLSVLNKWPVPIKEELDLGQLAEAADGGYSIDGNDEKSPFVGVLRSKGFCWMAPTKWIGANDDVWRHNTAM